MCSSCNSKKVCNGGKYKLLNYYNLLTTLYNITTDITLKTEYLQMRQEIMTLMNSKDCPTEVELTVIKNYIDNEYAKYQNSK